MGTHCGIPVGWMPLNITNEKSELVQVIDWCHSRQQAITWTSIDPDLCSHMAALGHSELIWHHQNSSCIDEIPKKNIIPLVTFKDRGGDVKTRLMELSKSSTCSKIKSLCFISDLKLKTMDTYQCAWCDKCGYQGYAEAALGDI